MKYLHLNNNHKMKLAVIFWKIKNKDQYSHHRNKDLFEFAIFI